MFALEHSRSVYWADFAFYGLFVGSMTASLPMLGPREQWTAMAILTTSGLIGWSLIEYLMHRFILHGLEPFKTWHLQHHARPTALISSPTVLSAALIAALVFAPAWAFSTAWKAAALTLGVVAGYLAYALCHHGTHHWRANRRWFKERKLWHALHHRGTGPGQCYGVTSTLWDRVFRTIPRYPPTTPRRKEIHASSGTLGNIRPPQTNSLTSRRGVERSTSPVRPSLPRVHTPAKD